MRGRVFLEVPGPACHSRGVRLRAAALAFALASCSRPQPSAEFALRIGAVGVLGPLSATGGEDVAAVAQDLVYQPLARLREDGSLAAGVPGRLERRAGNRYWLALDPGVRFSDGAPATAADVVASLRAFGLSASEAEGGVDIGPGELKVPVELGLGEALLFRETPAGILGTGPFAVESTDAERMVLRRVTEAPGKIARVEIVVFPTTRDAFARALRGDVNAVLTLDARQAELLEGVPGLRILRAEAPQALTLAFNAARLEGRERAALAAGLPLDEVASAYDRSCRVERRERAEKLSFSRPLRIVSADIEPGLGRAALALRRALGPSGGILVVGSSEELERIEAQGSYDLMVAALLVWPPAVAARYWITGSPWNRFGYSNPAYDRSVERGDLAAAAAELRRDPPAVTLCRRTRIAAIDSRLRNATLGGWGLLETLADWEVGP